MLQRQSSSATAEREAKDYATLGNKHAEQGNFLEAIYLYSEASKRNPKDYRFLGNRSFCYEQVGQYEKALYDAQECLKIHPSWPKGHFRKGKALQGLQKYREAVVVFDQVLTFNPDCSEASDAKMQAAMLHLQNLECTAEEAENLLDKHGSLEEALKHVDVPSKGVGNNQLPVSAAFLTANEYVLTERSLAGSGGFQTNGAFCSDSSSNLTNGHYLHSGSSHEPGFDYLSAPSTYQKYLSGGGGGFPSGDERKGGEIVSKHFDSDASPPLTEMHNEFVGVETNGGCDLSQNSNLGDSGKGSSGSTDLSSSGCGGFNGIKKSSFPDLTTLSINGVSSNDADIGSSEFVHNEQEVAGRRSSGRCLLASEALLKKTDKDSMHRTRSYGDRPLSSSDSSSIISSEAEQPWMINAGPRAPAVLPKLVVKHPVKRKTIEPNMDPANTMKVATLWVGNLQTDCNKKTVLAMFAKYGTIKSSNFMLDNHCAFINYYDHRAASDAMRGLQDIPYESYRLKIKFPDRMLGAAATVLRKASQPSSKPVNGALSSPASSSSTSNGSKRPVEKSDSSGSAKLAGNPPSSTPADQRRKGPMPNGECYFWRTTGCRYEGKCAHIHKPENKGIDKKIWMQ